MKYQYIYKKRGGGDAEISSIQVHLPGMDRRFTLLIIRECRKARNR
jgi:hypothetical protein